MHIRTGITFESAATGEKFQARVTANGRTKNIVYLIECRRRINGNRSDYYRKLPDKPFAEHFNVIGHSFEGVSVMVIEQIMAVCARRKQPESFWIHTIQTLAPDGLNLDP